MSKPIILVIGVPHSFTSMVSNFLIDNGGYAFETWDDPQFKMGYSRFEDEEIQNYVNRKKNFKSYDLTEYFSKFPEDKVCIIKHPRATFYLDDIQKYTEREIKLVYVIRNPEQIILSSMDKAEMSFIYYFERLVWMYDCMVDTDLQVYALIAERIKQEAPRLLEYCSLNNKEIDYKSLRPIKKEKQLFSSIGLPIFFWKRLSRFFRLM